MPHVSSIGRELPPRLRWYVLTAILAGVPVVAGAALVAARRPLSLNSAIGIGSFFVLAMVAEWRPVPIDVEGKRLVSLAFVFIVSSQLLFGWEWSILIGALAIGLAMALDRYEPLKALFNAATYALATALAALPVIAGGGARDGYGLLALSVVASGSIFVCSNVFLVCVAIGFATGTRVLDVFREHLRYSGPIFAISVFVAAQAVILWRLSAPLVILLSAPLFALTMYQRSSLRGRIAEAAASTDSLTSLKNRRAYSDESEPMLEEAQLEGERLALCLLDVDRFKQVNDRHGHAMGDAILQALGAAIRQTVPESGYRLGGDEFLLLVPARNHAEVVAAVQARFDRGQAALELAEPVTVSAGVALFPEHADDLHTLQKRADFALYRSKYGARGGVTVFDDALTVMPFPNAPFGAGAGVRDSRLLTAHRIVTLVDAVAAASARERGVLSPADLTEVLDRWTGFNRNHSQAVAELAVALAQRLGVEGDDLEQLYLAALLHDVGKIALPDSVLGKPGPLAPDERALVERHPVIGYELLADLGSPLAATLVLHHHERWDGDGYPHGLAGADIPFGSRVILVADAFDALTSDRSYRRAVSVEAAVRELQRESGYQLDPLVTAALAEHFAHQVREPRPDTSLRELEAAWSSSTSFS